MFRQKVRSEFLPFEKNPSVRKKVRTTFLLSKLDSFEKTKITQWKEIGKKSTLTFENNNNNTGLKTKRLELNSYFSRKDHMVR